MKLFTVTFIIFFALFHRISSDAVCSEDELIRELKEDIADNGKLDCLREIISTHPEDETPEQIAKRLAAEWNGDCSFEAEGSGEADWFTHLQQNYGLKRGLVDVNGNPVDKDFDDQADMCEIIRALISSGKFEGTDDLTNLNVDFLDHIDCAGTDGQTEVCAATAGSYANKNLWYILLDGSAIKLDNKPKFVPAPETD